MTQTTRPLPTRFLATLLAILLGWVAPAAAGPGDQPEPTPDSIRPADAPRVAVSAVPSAHTVRPGDRLIIAVIFNHATGWHIWPESSVSLPPAVDESAQRTTIDLPAAPPAGIAGFGGIQWPVAKPTVVPDPSGGGKVTVPTYGGRAIAYIPVEIAPTAAPGARSFDLTLHFQACDETSCMGPEDPTLTVSFTIGSEAGPPNQPDLFAGFDASKVQATSAATPGGPSAAQTDNPAPNLFGFSLPRPDSTLAVLILLLVSIVGGAVLNLTPCVLPVIPIKIMTLVHHAGSAHRAWVLGLWMALGVVVFWVAAGLPMALFSSALDPSRIIFGTWWVTLSLGLIIAAMGLGIMGLFMINLPQSLYMVNPKVDSPWGSFVFGIMTAILGLPCFGFVAGGLLAGAATLPPFVIMVIFLGLGLGMALPYLILSAKPGLVDRIPRTGPASELVKQVMGLLLLAAAAFFIAAGIKSLLAEKPYLAESMAWWAVAFFVVLAGLWLTLRTLQISKKAWPRLVMPGLAIGASAIAILFANGLAATAREDHIRRATAVQSDDSIVTGAWLPYTPARFERALASGKVVVADFTADWCINCKFLKRTYLDRDPVRARVQKDDVILIEVDLTSKSAPGWRFLADLGRSNVPTLAVFGPGVTDPILYNAYTSEHVISAIDRARGLPAGPAPDTQTLGRSY
ncbi:MAG: thioredoxin family protein [Phycisphaerales bacterium]|nr:thioredoxin family protein [Phycisphaerales bacterium]